MKKNYILFIATWLLCLLLSPVNATVYIPGDTPVTSFKDGDTIVLVNTTPSTTFWEPNAYLNGDGYSAAIQESCLIRLESANKAGKLAGQPSFYLKQISTGLYYGGGENLLGAKSDALPFEVIIAKDHRTDTIPDAGYGYGSHVGITDDNLPDDAVIFTYPDQTGYSFLGTYEKVVYWYASFHYNAWHAYYVTPKNDPQKELQDLVTTYSSFVYRAGKNPGQFPEDAVVAYDSAFSKAKAASVATLSSDEYATFAATLKAAKENVDSMEIPITTGYYYLRNAWSSFKIQYGKDVALTYTTYNNSHDLFWGIIDSTSADYAFYIQKNSDGTYTISNLGTGEYMNNTPTGYGWYVGLGTEPKMQYIYSYPQTGGQFCISYPGNGYYLEAYNGRYTSYKGDWVRMWSGSANSSSAWYLDRIDDSLVSKWKAEIAQAKLTQAYQELLAKSQSAYAKAVIYTDLLSESTQYYSNHPMTSDTNSAYKNLLDGSASTYFMSDSTATDTHFLLADLRKAPQTAIKFWTSMRAGNKFRPIDIDIYATNDSVKAYTGATSELTHITEITDGLFQSAGRPDYESPAINLGASYRFIRFQILKTNTSTDGGKNCFAFSEFNITPAAMEDTSSAKMMSPAIVTDLHTAIDNAKDAVDNIKLSPISTDQYNSLLAAYNAFMNNYPDGTLVSDALSKLEALYSSSVSGTEMGQVDPTVFASTKTAIDNYKATSVKGLDRTAIDNIIAKVNASQKTFLDAVVRPASGHWYYIANHQNETTSPTYAGNCIYTLNGNDNAKLYWGGYDATAGNLTEGTLTGANYMWEFIPMGDSAVAIRNLASSYYMGNYPGMSSMQYSMSATPVPYVITFMGNSEFTIAPYGTSVIPLHAQVSNKAVVAWNYSARNASAWTFKAVASDQDAVGINMIGKSLYGMCLPYAVTNIETGEYAMYKVCDKTLDANKKISSIKLTKVSSVDAGVPFILEVGNHAQYDANNLDTVNVLFAVDLTSTAIADAPQAGNGLIGNFSSKTYKASNLYGYVLNGSAYVLTGDQTLSPNSAIILGKDIQTDASAKVDLTLSFTNGQLDKIQSVTSEESSVVNVYNIQGQTIAKNVSASQALKSLKPGLYIIGKKKVMVK